jgi:hypothetical protein
MTIESSATADWKQSWKIEAVSEAEWSDLLASFRSEYLALLAAIDANLPWADDMKLTGILAMVAHAAWHLGALRQALGLVTLPTR